MACSRGSTQRGAPAAVHAADPARQPQQAGRPASRLVAMAATAPEPASSNPLRRVLDDLRRERTASVPFPPGPGNVDLARTLRFARDPLPLLLSAYRTYGPIF